MKLQKWHVTIAIICLISGILLAWNLRAQEKNFNSKTSIRKEALADKIKKLNIENKKLENDISTLKSQINNLQQSDTQGQGQLKDFQNKLLKAKQLAGLTDLKGPGIKITLDDSSSKENKIDPNDLLVHYNYIFSMINALKIANADAISFNGERFVTNSDIICGGTIILANRTPVGPPFTILALGDPVELERIVTKYSDYQEIKKKGLPITIDKKEEITIPAYKGSFSFPYTKIKEGAK